MTVLKKPAETSAPILDLLRERWSPRAFLPKPVPQEILRSVLEAGRWAASSNNGQPWRLILATIDDPAAHAVAVSCFNARNQRWTRNVPVLMFSCARKIFDNGNPNVHCWYDTGACLAQLTMQAEAHGLRVHQAAGIEHAKIRETYAVPDEFDICAGVAMGYQGDPDSLIEDLPGRERETRVRKPLEQFVFSARFGTGAKLG